MLTGQQSNTLKWQARLNTDKDVLLVLANLVAHVIDARALEVDETAAGAAMGAEHLLRFADLILVGDVDWPAFKRLV